MSQSARYVASIFLILWAGCSTASSTARRTTAVPASQPATTVAFGDAFPETTNPRETIPFLASDSLAGRMPGTEGLNRAGDFLADELSRIGVKPLPGQTNYFQTFSIAGSSALSPSTHLTINGEKMVVNKDFSPIGLSAEKAFTGKITFVGFGVTRGPGQYDDYAQQDVRGKVVLAMMKEPLDAKGLSRFAAVPGGPAGQWSDSVLFVTKAKNAADHGAIALLLVDPPSSGRVDTVNPYTGDVRTLASLPVIQITRRMANLLLSIGGSQDLKTLQDSIYASFEPHSSSLNDVEVAGSIAISKTNTAVRNVMAYLPGAGPLADEWVVVGAHYDHLGRGQLGHIIGGPSGSIWHGADDNASGTAVVLELSEKLKHRAPLPRSVLFIFFTAEEEGLIGSDYFVKNPLIPLNKIVAMLNLDMVGRLRNNSLQIGGAGTAPIFDSIVNAAIANTSLTTSTALPDDGGRGGKGPSDHMSFASQKIPVLFLFTGMHADYHRPTDTADKINYTGVDLLAGVSERILTSMASMPRQTYDAGSDTNVITRMPTGVHGHRAILGIVPDDSTAQSATGVPISGVVPEGPADIAGFKPGDRIVAFNGKVLKTLDDLSQGLDDIKAGDKVSVKVLRDGKPVELYPVLNERK